MLPVNQQIPRRDNNGSLADAIPPFHLASPEKLSDLIPIDPSNDCVQS